MINKELELQDKTQKGELNMQYGIQIVNGFLFFSGGILAAAFFKAVLHMSICM